MGPSKCCGKWGPEQKPEELTGSVTDLEYQQMRDTMHGYVRKGICIAAGFSVLICGIFLVISIATGKYAFMSHTWFIGPLFSICLGVAISMAKAKINANILGPKGMNLECDGCCAHKIVRGKPSPGSVGDTALTDDVETPGEQVAADVMELDAKSRSDAVFGTKERERTPANYGAVELTHSSRNDLAEDVVRSMYMRLSGGAKRSERIIACNMEIVYVPEEDLLDLLQVYNSRPMGELRTQSKREDGARRVLRFFNTNGASLAADNV